MKNNATNSTGMKLNNRRLILNIVKKKPVSRAELARITGLTRAAVTLIVDELIKCGILIETGTAEADYGRKPVLLDLNSNSYYAVGVSIKRDGCNIGIMNIKGVLLEKRRVNLSSSFDVNENIKIIIEDVKKIIAESSLPWERFLGIGISTPGPVDINMGIILNPPNFNIWHNVKIVQEFKKNFHFNIFLENNSTSLALAEKNYGRGAEYKSFMLLVADTGIGAGIIINEEVYRGVGGFGSEVGHTSIDINGKACSCGNRGCLEVYASIPSVLESIQRYGKNITTWNEVVDMAFDGDEVCRKAVESEALYLSAGIVNAMNILELEAVILTGDIQYRPEMFLDLIRKNAENAVITRHIHKLHIMNSSIAKDSGVISSAAIIFEKYFRGEVGV
jgi:predicted NBD/HSP70 family sugar kinase